jgi:WD40 repeat protein
MSRAWFTLILITSLSVQADGFPGLSQRFDACGDRLPDRAIVRFGTGRFRHPGPIQTVAYSPDGKLVAAASGDPSMVRIWERGSGVLR